MARARFWHCRSVNVIVAARFGAAVGTCATCLAIEHMIKIYLKRADLDTCVTDAQHERLVITRNGKPVALVVGVEGMDEEQLQLGSSAKFWQLVTERRKQKTMSRTQLEQMFEQRRN